MLSDVACPIANVPLDVLHRIFAELSPWDLGIIARVCSTFKRASENEILWKPFCSNENLNCNNPNSTWKNFFLTHSIRLLPYKLKNFDNPALSISDESIYVRDDLWLIKICKNDNSKRAFISYKQKEIDIDDVREGDVFFKRGDLLALYHQEGETQYWKVDEKNDIIPMTMPEGMFDHNSQWLLGEKNNKLLILSFTTQKVCASFSPFQRGIGDHADSVKLLGDFLVLFKASDSTLNLYDLTTALDGFEVSQPIPFKSVKAGNSNFCFRPPLLAYVSDDKLQNQVTLFNFGDDTTKEISLNHDHFMGVYGPILKIAFTETTLLWVVLNM